jgi:hypothetical protein
MAVRVTVRIDGRVLRRGTTTVDYEPVLAKWLTQYADGASVDVECEHRPGKGLVAVNGIGLALILGPKELIEDALRRGAVDEALGGLAELGEDAVVASADLLRLRIRAAPTLADFERLLARPDAKTMDFCATYEALPRDLQGAAAAVFASWAGAHLARCQPWGVARVLERVPVGVWPLEVAISACEDCFRAPNAFSRPTAAKKWIARARRLAPDDSRVIALDDRDAEYRRHVAVLEQEEDDRRLASRPDFDDIERMFDARLPKGLRRAWAEAYEGPNHLRFIEVAAGRFEELESSAELMREEHGLGALLPFAHGREDADYLVLDLTRPTKGGDYPVLRVMHDDIDGVKEVAPSSAAWLKARR